MNELIRDTQYLVLTGNYGSGKTELALNLALGFAPLYRTTLVDLDIVNPYFRSGGIIYRSRKDSLAGRRLLPAGRF